MKRRISLPLLMITLFAAGVRPLVAEKKKPGSRTGKSVVVTQTGEFPSPGGTCRAEMKRSGMGGFLILTFNGKASPRVNDITGIAWISADDLVYTTSPIYGHPGVYMYSCESRRITRLVAPTTFNPGYPKGADYFELEAVSKDNSITVYYYYAADVDRLDVKKLRTPDHIVSVTIRPPLPM